jgi:signal transduction histidine kinase
MGSPSRGGHRRQTGLAWEARTGSRRDRQLTFALQSEEERLAQLLSLHERDRQLLAFEIHDGLTQYIAAALLHFEAFRQTQQKDPDRAWQSFQLGQQLLRRSVDESRRVINGLRPPMLDELGLVAAIEHLVKTFPTVAEAEIEFVHDVSFERLAAPLEGSIYRVVQECLTNALRHSRSRRIRVRLVEQNDTLRVDVQDWGVGFRPEKAGSNRFGLQGIRHRAALFGGRATIQSAPGQGTRIIVEFPLDDVHFDKPW